MLVSLWRHLDRLHSDEQGATMVEYGLMVALIAVIALAAVTLVGLDVAATFQAIADAIV